MPVKASDVKLDADNSSHRPRLVPPSDSDEADKWPPTDSDAEDKDEDVVADAVAVLLVLLPDVDPLSQQSQQDGRQGTWRLRPRAEDIMRHHPRRSMSRPLHTRTSRRGFANWNACYSCGFDVPDGHISQTCPHHMRKPDLTICESRTTTSTSPDRMRRSTSTRSTTAQLRTATRRFSHRRDG
jgi:hypothetical protein